MLTIYVHTGYTACLKGFQQLGSYSFYVLSHWETPSKPPRSTETDLR
jgi:hypothetical protein